jgi:hypothetical protein
MGRYGRRPTAEATRSFVLDAKLLKRVRAGLFVTVNAMLGEEEFPIELTIDTRGPCAGFLELAHDSRSTHGEPKPMCYRVWLTTTRPQFGGSRYWLLCPSTGRRVAKLYLPLGGHRFLSRAAYRLGYESQREVLRDRLTRKVRKIIRRMGFNPEEWEVPPKPKHMRWVTYNRLIERIETYESMSDALAAEVVMRRFARYL